MADRRDGSSSCEEKFAPGIQRVTITLNDRVGINGFPQHLLCVARAQELWVIEAIDNR
jgi:hypothetical protein